METYDAGHLPDGRPYVLMELLQGLSLGEVLQRRPRLPPRDACALLRQVCDAVASEHAADIVHRDLKLECLSGVRPFRGGSYAELAALVLYLAGPPAQPEVSAPTTPAPTPWASVKRLVESAGRHGGGGLGAGEGTTVAVRWPALEQPG